MRHAKLKVGASLALLAVGASVAIMTRSTVASNWSSDATHQVALSAYGDLLPTQEVRLQGWGYRLVRDSNGVSDAVVLREFSNKAELDHYVQVNRSLARQLAAQGETELSVMITFHEPRPVPEFRSWASRTPLKIDAWELHYTSRDGEGQGQLGGRPEPEGLVSDRQVAAMLSSPGRNADDLVIKGIYAVDGRVQADSYDRIANDPAVYLADITRSAVRDHVIKTVPGIDSARLTSSVRNVYDLLLKAKAGTPLSNPGPSVTTTPTGAEPATKSRINPMTGR